MHLIPSVQGENCFREILKGLLPHPGSISSLLQSLTLSDCPVGYVWYVLIRVPVMWCSLHFLKPGVLLGPYEELRVSPILLRTPQLRCLAPKGSCCNNNEGKPLLFSFREVCKGAIMLCSSAGQGTQERRNLFYDDESNT